MSGAASSSATREVRDAWDARLDYSERVEVKRVPVYVTAKFARAVGRGQFCDFRSQRPIEDVSWSAEEAVGRLREAYKRRVESAREALRVAEFQLARVNEWTPEITS